MGAKDAICKIANLTISLGNTFAYYKTAKVLAGYTMFVMVRRMSDVNDGMTKPKFCDVYGYLHTLPNGILGAMDAKIKDKL
eukprot:410234-Heterocapsa_arctica.AAC.2